VALIRNTKNRGFQVAILVMSPHNGAHRM
jgi:hypothetical protein